VVEVGVKIRYIRHRIRSDNDSDKERTRAVGGRDFAANSTFPAFLA